MFCVNCGKQIPDGQRLCADCAAQQAPQQPAEQPAPQAPVYEAPQQPVYQPPQPGFEVSPPTKKSPKLSGGKIALIAVAAVLVVAVLLAAFNWEGIARAYNRSFAEPAEYLADVEVQNVEKAAKSIADHYALVMDSAETVPVAGTNRTKLTLKVNDSILTMLENVMAEEAGAVDLSWLKQIDLTFLNNNQGEELYSCDIGVGVNGVELVTLRMIMDMETMKLYIAIPELNEQYLMLDMARLSEVSVTDFRAAFTQSSQLTAEMVELMPEPEQVEELIVTYGKLLVGSFTDVEKADETVEVDGVEQKLLKMTVTLTEREIYDLAVAVLEQAKDDETIKDLVAAMQDYVDQIPDMEGYHDLAALYEASVDELLTQLEEAESEVTEDTALEMDTYLDGEDNIVGRTLRMEMDGEMAEMYYILVKDGDEFAFKAEASAALLTGSGTVDDDVCDGEFLLNVFGNDFLTLEVKELQLADDGTSSGSLVLIPESALLAEMGLDSSLTALAGGNLALELKLAGDENMEIGILAGGETMLSLAMALEEVRASAVTVPEDAINFTGENDLLLWMMGIKVDQLVAGLEQADVPEEWVDMVRQLGDALASFG